MHLQVGLKARFAGEGTTALSTTKQNDLAVLFYGRVTDRLLLVLLEEEVLVHTKVPLHVLPVFRLPDESDAALHAAARTGAVLRALVQTTKMPLHVFSEIVCVFQTRPAHAALIICFPRARRHQNPVVGLSITS